MLVMIGLDAEVRATPVFERLVNAERDLLSLLDERLEQHQPLLNELRAVSGS
jgi:hypothetical protein